MGICQRGMSRRGAASQPQPTPNESKISAQEGQLFGGPRARLAKFNGLVGSQQGHQIEARKCHGESGHAVG